MTVASAEAMVSADTIRTGALDSLKDSMHTPHIAQRGLKFNIPLDLRTPSYSDNSHSAQANIPEMWSVEFWRRVMQMAKDRGVDVYWFTWNTFLHSEEGKHGLSRAKPDENLARYFRASVRETVKTYPLLAGMGITAGEYMGEGLEPESPRQLVMQKQWFSFMLWGRLSYDPTLPDDLFKRTLAARFPEVPAANLRRHAEAAKRRPARWAAASLDHEPQITSMISQPSLFSRLSLSASLRNSGFATALLLLSSCLTVQTATPPTPASPNILFAIADDWGYGHAGAYDCKWVKTPAFDRVADQGILFSHAYTPNAKCAPSRACILTGRNSWQLKAAANHVPYFPPEFKTFFEALDEHGWFVGHTTKGWAPGIATNTAGKPRQMTGKAFNTRTAKPPATGIGLCDYAANFSDFLDAAPVGKPWCFWYGAIEPHRGYEYGSGVAKGGKKTADVDRVPGYWPDNETIRNDLLDYAFEVEHFDQHLATPL